MNIANCDHIDSANKGSLAHISMLLEPTSYEGTGQEDWRKAFPNIIGESEPMQKMKQIAHKIARSDCSVLICGESGTGKELIANALHRLSHRSKERIITINCSAIPENLLESHFFGHVKGAFTGANNYHPGYFESAHRGSVFLDEIGDMPPAMQAKLLRVVQEKKVCPVGSNEEKNADVRIIAATNVDLAKAVAENHFRHDLFYRLNVLPINVPPLRERGTDILLLLDHFLEISNRKHFIKSPCYLTETTRQLLVSYRWPGNVRQVQNLVERLVVISGGGPIDADLLPPEFKLEQVVDVPAPHIQGAVAHIQSTMISIKEKPTDLACAPTNHQWGILPEEGIDLIKMIESLENSYILQALQRTGNNKNQAARLLGLNRTTLVERIKKRRLAPLNAPSEEL